MAIGKPKPSATDGPCVVPGRGRHQGPRDDPDALCAGGGAGPPHPGVF